MAVISKRLGDILKTSGAILKPGSFISSNGTKCVLTPSDIEMVYNNLDKSVPMAITHDNTAETIGFALEIKKEDDVLTHNGSIYKADIFKDAIIKGYSHISPEIDFTTDDSGNILDAKLTSLRFVKSPAISGNDINVTSFKFSSPEETMPEETTTTPAQPTSIPIDQLADLLNNVLMPKIESVIESKFKTITPETPNKGKEFFESHTTPQVTEEPPAQPTPKSQEQSTDTLSFTPLKVSNDPITKDVFDEYTSAQQKIAEQDIKLKQLNEEVQKIRKKEYNEIKNELKTLGVSDPDKLVNHIEDYDQKIKTLQAFKSSVARTTPMNSNESVPPMSNEGGNNKNIPFTVEEVILSENGDPSKYTTEQLEQFSRRWKVPIRR